MRALDLQTNMACSMSGRSLSSNYVPPCLENKLLTQASSSLPSTSLQPSGLTSTSSSLLLTSSSSISSPLLSTQNPLLNSSCLTSIAPSTTNPLLTTSLAGSDLLSQFSQLPSFLSREGHLKRDDEGGEDISEAQPCSFEETSIWYILKMTIVEDSVSSEALSSVCVYPALCHSRTPIFVQELNIRITANFLLALAANHPSTKCHVRRYFCATVQLPSDWLEIVGDPCVLCFSRSLPMCLKKAMADKFKEFSEYQLAKYNTRKHRCKHNRNRRASKVWHLLSLLLILQVDAKKTVDKKQNEFNMKKMIKKLHIKEPAEHVMAILGRKYPADQKAFTFSGLKGDWERERAGQRMKLKDAETWERLLSQEGNKAATWEKLIDNKSLPFMAMLRNLRNMIRQGISMTHHQKILSRLTNKVRSVLQSRQFPFRFLSAYKVIMELRSLCDLGEKVVSLLDRYRKALETAVQISCRYNIPPLPGCTIILININMDERLAWGKNLDFCLPPESEHEDEEEEEEEEEEDDDRKKKKKKNKEDKLSPLNCQTKGEENNSKNIRWKNLPPKTEEKKYKKIQFNLFELIASSSRLLDHVEHLDKVYNVPPPAEAKDPDTTNSLVSIPASPKSRWRSLRVFISSTFRDMHAERDVLVRSVFPDLRRRAAPHCIHLQEVELRWGVTEEESGRAASLCLAEVDRSHMMVAILGQRYGLVSDPPALPDLPQYEWVQKILLYSFDNTTFFFSNLVIKNVFMYLIIYFPRTVPVAWKSHFAAESKEAESKMARLKRWIHVNNYQCEWGGVVEGKPYLKNLEEFSKAVLEDLWEAVKQFVNVSSCLIQAQFLSRAKLLSAAVEMVEQAQASGGAIVVEGAPGQGKTVFMVTALRKCLFPSPTSGYTSSYDNAWVSCQHIYVFLYSITLERDLLSEFHATLKDLKRSKPLVLLVDGVDLVRDDWDQLSSGWIPQQIPMFLCVASTSPLLQALSKKKSTLLFTLPLLTMIERKEIVQKELEGFGKKLSDAAFNNQLQTLIMKKGAECPLYLHMACEDLRNFATFDKVPFTVCRQCPTLTLIPYDLICGLVIFPSPPVAVLESFKCSGNWFSSVVVVDKISLSPVILLFPTDKTSSLLTSDQRAAMDDCRAFLQRHAAVLSRWPALFVQQALNEPPETPAHAWAQGLLGSGSARAVEWLNNDHQTFTENRYSGNLNLLHIFIFFVWIHNYLNITSCVTPGQEVKSLVSSCDGISSCVVLKNGCIATTSFDGQIEIWDAAKGCRTSLIKGHTNVITSSDITTDRKHLATASLDFTLKVAGLPSDSPLNCVSFDHEDRLLAAGCWDGKIVVWKWLQDNTQWLCGHSRSVRSLSFSPSSSSMLCSGSVSGEVRVWSVETSTCVGCFQAHAGAADTLAFLDQGRLLLTAGSDHMVGTSKWLLCNSNYRNSHCNSNDCTIFLWQLSELSEYNSEPPAGLLKGHSGVVTCLAFSPDGGQLLSGGKDKALVVWDMSVIQPPVSKVLPAFHRDWITGCVWTPDCVISSSNDGRLCLWDVEAAQSLREITWTSPLTSVSCQGPYVTAGCAEGSLHVWKWETSVNICHIPAHEGPIHACFVVTDAKKNPEDLTVLTAAQDGIVRLWKPLQVEHFSTFQGHSGAIRSVAHKGSDPDFLTVSKDCSLRSWMWETGVVRLIHTSLDFFLGGGGVVGILRLKAVQLVFRRQQHHIFELCAPTQAHHDKISVLRLTRSLIISASFDRTVKLWERSTKKQVGMFVCSGPVVLLEVNPENPSEFVCGDTLGKLYFLSWRE
uniref:TROVE domain-containing protein n=1 Tax=Hippocampus comes TaxID=109280 RepID=A0A3Q2ZC95_HIPCM